MWLRVLSLPFACSMLSAPGCADALAAACSQKADQYGAQVDILHSAGAKPC